MKVSKIELRPDKITENELNFLFENWYNFMMLGLRRRGFIPPDCEDILQMTFMYFWEFRSKYNNKYSIYTYLYRQLSRSIIIHSHYINKHDKAVELMKQDGTTEDELFLFQDEETDTDLLLMGIQRMPPELRCFAEAYLQCASRKDVIALLTDQGYDIDEQSYGNIYRRMVRYLRTNERELWYELYNLFRGKSPDLSNTEKAYLLTSCLEEGDSYKVHKSQSTLLREVHHQIEEFHERGISIIVREDDDYLIVERI